MTALAPDSTPEQARRYLLSVYSATFFVRFAFGVTVSVYGFYITGHTATFSGESFGTVGLVSALAPVGEFSTVLLSGAAADRYGRFRVLYAGMILAAILFGLDSTTRSVYVLGALNLLFGVSSGAILAASLAIVADHAEEVRRGHAMGRFDAVNLLGWILGFALGFGILDSIPNSALPWIFRLGAFLLAAGFALTWRLVQSAGGRPRVSRGSTGFRLRTILPQVFRRETLLVTVPWFAIYMLIGTAFVFLGSASKGIGISSLDLALVIGGGGLLLLATQPSFGRLSDRFGRMRMMMVGTAGFVGVLAGAAALAAYGARPILLAGVGVSVLFALAYGPAALAALADLSVALSRATAMAIYTLVIALGMIVGLGVFSQLYSRLGNLGLDLFFAVIGVTLVVFTLVRYRDVRLGRAGGTREASLPAAPTTPVQ